MLEKSSLCCFLENWACSIDRRGIVNKFTGLPFALSTVRRLDAHTQLDEDLRAFVGSVMSSLMNKTWLATRTVARPLR